MNRSAELDALLSLSGEEAWELICKAYPDLNMGSQAHMIAYIPMPALKKAFMDTAVEHGVTLRLWPMWERAYDHVKSLHHKN